MNKISTPQSRDWENFWGREASQKFQNVSWSKRRILRTIAPYLRSGANALDAGCGSGFFAKHFLEQGMEVTALDYSPAALKMAETLTGGQAAAVRADMLKEKLSERLNTRFDVIFTDGLFEHFSTGDQDLIMQNLMSVLADGGHIITFVPNRFSPWEIIRPMFMPGIEEDPFVLPQLVLLNERNGLTVIAKGGVNTLPFAVSPEGFIAGYFGMLLFTVARQK